MTWTAKAFDSCSLELQKIWRKPSLGRKIKRNQSVCTVFKRRTDLARSAAPEDNWSVWLQDRTRRRLHERECRGSTARCEPLVTLKNTRSDQTGHILRVCRVLKRIFGHVIGVRCEMGQHSIQIQPNAAEPISASQCKWTTTQSKLQKQQKS